jgi:indolepyruvate decarboxylase
MSSHSLSNAQFRQEFRTPEALTANSESETIASYLNKRLHQIGVRRVFAIPGDYTAGWVETLDDPERNPLGIKREHPNNEMCAAYAADGYGRASSGGVGCVSFTYGPGSLNAVNSIAGAYVESVPVVLVGGSPSIAQFNSQRDQGVLWHHMFDGSYTDLHIFENVTAMAIRIDNPTTGPDLIDAALRTCVTLSKPVYIEISIEIGGLPCRPVPDERLAAAPVPQDPNMVSDAVAATMKRLTDMDKTKNLVLLGGVEVARFGLQEPFAELCQLLQAPYLTTLFGKSILSEYRDDVYFSGIYNGNNTQQNVQDLIRSADCVISIGAQETDFNFAGLANATTGEIVTPACAIDARLGAIKMSLQDGENRYWGAVQLGPYIQALVAELKNLPNSKLVNAPYPGLASGTPWDIAEPRSEDGLSQITWDSFGQRLFHDFVSKDDIILADTGLSFYAFQNLRVDQDCYISQISWGSIGYAVAANYGAKLANIDNGLHRRAITITGDGAFAESVNAIGTIAQLGLNSVIFVIDNKIFGVEQWLINAAAFGEDAPPPEFAPLASVPQAHIWDYVKIAEGFGGKGYTAHTNEELDQVLEQLKANESDKTFSLVAVNIVTRDLPSNVKWKMRSDS